MTRHGEYATRGRAHDQQLLARGRCVDCREPKTDAEVARGRWHCRPCRLRRAAKAVTRRATAKQQTADRTAGPDRPDTVSGAATVEASKW